MKRNISSFKQKLKQKEELIDKRKIRLSLKHDNINSLLKEINLLGVELALGEIDEDTFEKSTEKLGFRLREELVKIGKRPDYFEVKYDCMHCKDTGYIGKKQCSCLISYLAEELKDKTAADEVFEKFDENLFSSNTGQYPKSPKENILTSKSKMLDFINNFDSDEEILGFIFMGAAGTGKTFLAGCTGNMLKDKGKDVKYFTSYEFEEILRSFGDEIKKGQVKELFDCEMLILDDLGVESQTDFINNNIFKLIDYRVRNKYKTIITTNLKLREIQDMYKSRIYSRLIGNFNFINFYGKDIRVEKRLRNKE